MQRQGAMTILSRQVQAVAASVVLAVLLAAVWSIPAAAQQDGAAPELKRITEVEGITEYRLTSNGLKVLLFPDPSKSTVTVNVTYLVGSRHEGRGEAGMAHLLEHMVFKGTPTYENIWGALQDHGANFNGTTWVDRTNYFESLPASKENLDFALHMESDRMVNSNISADELAREMTVVRNEFEMGENNPQGVLMERMMSAAYLWHNYGKSTIGNRSDIERVPAKSLKKFYQKYYQPDNAMLVVAGNFDVDWTKKKIIEYFGAIPKPQRVLEAYYTDEPTQDGPRHVRLERVGSVGAAGLMYHVPAGPHSDTAAIEVLTQLLTDEPSGRLYKELIETDKAVSIMGMPMQLHDPGVVLFMARVRDNQDVHGVLNEMEQIVEHVPDHPFTKEQVERIRTKILKNMKLAMTDSERVGVQLSEWEAMGDWRMMYVHRDRVGEVTEDDVNRVASAYFVASNRTSGVFVPTDEPQRAEIPTTPAVESIVEGYTGTEEMAMGEAFEATPENIERRTARVTLADGAIRAALLSKETMGDVVHGRLQFHFGTEAAMKDHTTALSMMPGLMMRGTTERSYQDIRDELDRIETQLVLSGGPGVIQVRLMTRREHLPEAVELLNEIMRQPSFPEDELEVIRKQRLAQLEQQKTEPMGLVGNALTRAMAPFPKDSIHYVPTIDEQIARTEAVTVDEIRSLYAKLVGASHVDVALVGDFDEESAESMLAGAFGGWKSPAPYERVVTPYRKANEVDETINTPDKQNAVVARGTTLQIRDDDAYYPALDFANFVLGQSPKSRLLTKLRHEGGMSYFAGSMLQVSDEDEMGALLGFAICNPANAPKVQETMQAEFRKWIRSGVTDEELEEFKPGYLEGYKGRFGDDGFVVQQLVEGLEIGRTFAYHRHMIDTVEDLTPEDVNAALSTYLSNATFADLKAGDTSKMDADGDG